MNQEIGNPLVPEFLVSRRQEEGFLNRERMEVDRLVPKAMADKANALGTTRSTFLLLS